MRVTVPGRAASASLMLLVLAWYPAPVGAAEPGIRNLDVRGLQVGGTTTLVLDGDDLGTAPRLLLPFPAKQTLQPKSTDKRATFEITLGSDVLPGYYHLRVVTPGGVSPPQAVAVDRLPQRPLAASVEQLPVALHGTTTGSTIVETRFPGKAGQKVMIEVEAQRLGSKLRPVVHLYGPKRLQVAWSWGTAALMGDTRLEATLPEDGPYTVAVHDAEYAGQTPGFFRLRIGQWAFVDQVFPPVVGKGRHSVQLLGPAAPAQADVTATRTATVLPLAWPGEGTWSGPRPFVTVSTRPEIVEQTTGGKIQELPAGRVGVSGRLLAPFEEDRYRIPVEPGGKVRLEVQAERLGSPLDVALVVRNDKGNDLARVEDGQGTLDPVLEYTVPDKTTAIVVAVVDAQGRGGPHGIYRLTVDPQPPSTGQTDFRLFTPSQRIALPAGGSSVVPVLIERRGYLGRIVLSAEGLPPGVTLEGAEIPPGADGALVTVRRSESAGGDAVITRWRGRADGGEEREVILRGTPLQRLQPWLATELAVAPTNGKAADFRIDWRNLPADAGIVPARKLALPVKVTRTDAKSPVRLTLVTSQVPPLVNNQPDPNRLLRPEKPVELAANANEGEVSVLVPPQLDADVYDVTVQAELLAPDRRTVLATAHAPVRRLPVRQPLVVRLDGPARIEAKRDPKTGVTFEIKGTVERREGLTGDVALALTGLPPGARADAVTVKAPASAFVVKGVLPANVPAGEIKGLKLAGTAAPDPKQPNVRVRSRDVELIVVVQAAK
jgi:hypothetical protein